MMRDSETHPGLYNHVGTPMRRPQTGSATAFELESGIRNHAGLTNTIADNAALPPGCVVRVASAARPAECSSTGGTTSVTIRIGVVGASLAGAMHIAALAKA